jgi:hypothetical protein
MGTIIGSPAVYDGISNTWWKYTGSSCSFEERDADAKDIDHHNLNQQKYESGAYKMRRGRISCTGTQTFQRASIDAAEINALGIPQ